MIHNRDSIHTNCWHISEKLTKAQVFPTDSGAAPGQAPFRISPTPFSLDPATFEFLHKLGPALLDFYRATNTLYRRSRTNEHLRWVTDYLNLGKTERVINYGRMNRFRHDLPLVIRPDIIPTETGFVITELDAVPGGMGLLAALNHAYSTLGYDVIGGPYGMIDSFRESLKHVADQEEPVVAIAVSDESQDYQPEMCWLAERLTERGLRTHQVHPRDLIFQESGLYAYDERVDVLYRFFELFDLPNIPKIDLVLYAIRKELLRITPPLKSYLEEKLIMGLFHNPRLSSFWHSNLKGEHLSLLNRVFPKTWILDPTPLPNYAVIPGLTLNGQALAHWSELKGASRRQRNFVIKPSGFSELAWGSRGVVVGNDVNNEEWSDAIDDALKAFGDTPHILQEFHKGKKFKIAYYDFGRQKQETMVARARLCPYYFVLGDTVQLAGVLATLCPSDKKIIHGMTDAVMTASTVMSTDIRS
ncbi:MAG: hypothetical protein M0Q40_00320 [Limnochordia bacterium]|nr:hypothetical protein [Limnochordia bacterium]MDD4518463.1 hypothetical protein [Limnochordia bacterium]